MRRLLLKRKNRTTALLIIVSLILVSGCDPTQGSYPDQVSKQWICNDPKFTLYFDDETVGGKSNSKIYFDSYTAQVDVVFMADRFEVLPCGVNSGDKSLLSGTWEYMGNKLIFHIEHDSIFDERYNRIALSSINA